MTSGQLMFSSSSSSRICCCCCCCWSGTTEKLVNHDDHVHLDLVVAVVVWSLVCAMFIYFFGLFVCFSFSFLKEGGPVYSPRSSRCCPYEVILLTIRPPLDIGVSSKLMDYSFLNIFQER